MGDQPKPSTDRAYLMLGLRIIGDFGATIAIPVVVLAYVGKRLDGHYGTGPWLTILGFIIAASITTLLIRKKAIQYGNEYNAIEDTPRED